MAVLCPLRHWLFIWSDWRVLFGYLTSAFAIELDGCLQQLWLGALFTSRVKLQSRLWCLWKTLLLLTRNSRPIPSSFCCEMSSGIAKFRMGLRFSTATLYMTSSNRGASFREKIILYFFVLHLRLAWEDINYSTYKYYLRAFDRSQFLYIFIAYTFSANMLVLAYAYVRMILN